MECECGTRVILNMITIIMCIFTGHPIEEGIAQCKKGQDVKRSILVQYSRKKTITLLEGTNDTWKLPFMKAIHETLSSIHNALPSSGSSATICTNKSKSQRRGQNLRNRGRAIFMSATHHHSTEGHKLLNDTQGIVKFTSLRPSR